MPSPCELLRRRMDALRVGVCSTPRCTMDGEIIGRAHYTIFTYTPPGIPCVDEDYQLTEEQVRELVNLVYEVLAIAEGKEARHA